MLLLFNQVSLIFFSSWPDTPNLFSNSNNISSEDRFFIDNETKQWNQRSAASEIILSSLSFFSALINSFDYSSILLQEWANPLLYSEAT